LRNDRSVDSTVAILFIVPRRANPPRAWVAHFSAGNAHLILIFHALDFRHYIAARLRRRDVLSRRRESRSKKQRADFNGLGSHSEGLGEAKLLGLGHHISPNAAPPGPRSRRMPDFLPRALGISSRQL